MDSWFKMFAPSIRFPGGGDLQMLYDPYTYWEAPRIGNVGVPQIEKAVYSEVASPGKQLGILIDVVTAMVDIMEEKFEADLKEDERMKHSLEQLKHIHQAIAEIKTKQRASMKDAAKESLESLRAADREAFKDLISDFHRIKDSDD